MKPFIEYQKGENGEGGGVERVLHHCCKGSFQDMMKQSMAGIKAFNSFSFDWFGIGKCKMW